MAEEEDEEEEEEEEEGRRWGGSEQKESRFILMPKSNRLLHGIRDGITSYQRICTLHSVQPQAWPVRRTYATVRIVAQCRVEGREQYTSGRGNTRTLRIPGNIHRDPLSCQESRGMRRRSHRSDCALFSSGLRPCQSCCFIPRFSSSIGRLVWVCDGYDKTTRFFPNEGGRPC